MKTILMLFLGILFIGSIFVAAESTVYAVDPKSEDYQLIKLACLDYVEGYFESSSERIEKSVHPDLVKRVIRNNAVAEMTRTNLIEAAVGQKRTKPVIKVDIYDISGNIALAKITSSYIDYVQVGMINGKWQVINVLWANFPK